MSTPTARHLNHDPDHAAKALQVAQQYHILGMSQKQIALDLGISESTVSRLLQDALDKQIVRVSICPPEQVRLQSELLKFLGNTSVREVVVAAGDSLSVAQAAARYFEQRGHSGSTIVIDGGHTMAGFVKALAPGEFENITVIPIAADPPSYEASAYELMTRLALKYPRRVHCHKIPHWTGPGLDRVHRSACAAARNADFVFLGVGPWLPNYTALEFVRHLGLSPKATQHQYKNIAAVSGYLALDIQGVQVHMRSVERRMPRALKLMDIQVMASHETRRVVLAAATADKLESALTAIRAQLCNTLIVDEELAEALCRSFARATSGKKSPHYQ